MSRTTPLVGIGAVIAASLLCTNRAEAQQAPTVVVRIIDAYIAPTKVNSAAWDGNNIIDPTVIQAVGAAMALANPTIAIAAALAPIARKAWEPPDVYGDVELLFDGLAIPCGDASSNPDCTIGVNLPKIQDNYMPVWQNATLPSIQLTDHIKLKVWLADSDIPGYDPIGTIFLSADNLRTALANGGAVTHFRVGAQTNNQALLLGISVIQQSP